MERIKLFVQFGLVVLMVSLAVTAFAGPIITVDPATLAGPINCSDSVTYTVNYDRNDSTDDVWGFSVTVANGAFDYVTFDDSNVSIDVANVDWQGGFFATVNDGVQQLKIDAASVNGWSLTDQQASLFTFTLHGAATGLGELNIVNVELRDSANHNIVHNSLSNPMGTITVDCDAPVAPVMTAEPPFSPGTSNTVYWSAVTDPSTPVEYLVRCSDGSDSGWISATDYEFTGLAHGVLYTYDVMARDGLGNEGPYSATVSSTQDVGTPESAAGPLLPAYASWNINVPWVATDDLSGVAYVALWYQVDGGGWTPYGTTYATSPIAFTGSVDGDYEFYTIAVDVAGNTEVDPVMDLVITTLDTTAPAIPVLDAEPAFTQGLTNTLYWPAVLTATEYRVYCSNGADSGWIPALEYTFGGLMDATLYSYTVQSRDALANASVLSAAESSTQDDNEPASIITAPVTGYQITQNIPITVASSDPTSSVALIRLYYNLNNTVWVQFGNGFAGPVIPFVAPSDGVYDFYTIAEDIVGNVEAAPSAPDINLNVDTGGPSGTFVINGGDAYTTVVAVTIEGVFVDVNGVTQMQFSNDGITYSGWVPYGTPVAWNLTPGDGVKTVYGQYLDGSGNSSTVSASIELDTIAPVAVALGWASGLIPGHESVTLNWTETDPGDLASIEIWVSLYDEVQDAVGSSVYPEYNDTPAWPAGGSGTPGVLPTVAAHLDPDADWALLATVPVGDMTYVHTESSPWDRAVYGYYLFAKDHAGNYSPANSEWSRKSVNYIMGDFTDDGVISIGADVSPFAGAYGTVDGDAAYGNIYDIGPVSGGYPSTDNSIGFEDLMVLSMNFNAQAKAAVGDPVSPVLTWYQVDEMTWALALTEPCNSLKGIRLAHALPEGVVADVTMADALKSSSAFFLANNSRNGLDLGFAVLGNNSVFPGAGELLRVTTSEVMDLSKVAVEVRDAANNDLEFELESEPMIVLPTIYSLSNNYPNPFNPETTIKFSLPDAQDVKLEIFNIKGQRVRVLLSESMGAGVHSVVWNGKDSGGRTVSSGTYFYRVQAGPLNQTHRMLLVK